jgi:hypothetical protein
MGQDQSSVFDLAAVAAASNGGNRETHQTISVTQLPCHGEKTVQTNDPNEKPIRNKSQSVMAHDDRSSASLTPHK